MSTFSLLALAIGLSMDAFAVSAAKGMTMSKQDLFKYALILGLAFGLFQGGMPLLGWWAGSYFESFISSLDHWIAFLLLGFIGFHMIRDTTQDEEEEKKASALTYKTIFILAIATSIDALAVGISFAFLKIHILSAVIIIAITTFALSFFAVYAGHKVGNVLEKYAGCIGGVILILIGSKILIEHLFF